MRKCWRLVFSLHIFTSLFAIKPLPKDNFFEWIKLKALAEDNLDITEIVIYVFNRVENILGKGENAGYQHFLFFLTMFSKDIFPWVV